MSRPALGRLLAAALIPVVAALAYREWTRPSRVTPDVLPPVPPAELVRGVKVVKPVGFVGGDLKNVVTPGDVEGTAGVKLREAGFLLPGDPGAGEADGVFRVEVGGAAHKGAWVIRTRADYQRRVVVGDRPGGFGRTLAGVWSHDRLGVCDPGRERGAVGDAIGELVRQFAADVNAAGE